MSLSDEAQALLEQAGALKRGHFVLSSGLHSDRYCQCATLFENPELAARVAALMLEKLPRGFDCDVVLAPALGGVLWGYELARALGVRSLFAERLPGQSFELRRGFELRPGERVLLAEDVVTTGGSVSELVPLVEAAGATVAGYAVIADRSRGSFKPRAPLFALAELNFETYPPDRLPEHLRSIPASKPGSRVKTEPQRGQEASR
ncbi:MAG: orotate phosphoribosyltransferase [Planctomycetota bacterium]|nr:orotate phosphoribosyltransferase [Planctomycetota bacterium]